MNEARNELTERWRTRLNVDGIEKCPIQVIIDGGAPFGKMPDDYVDCRGIIFKGERFEHIDFVCHNFEHAEFTDCYFKHCRLDGSIFTNATFSQCTLNGVSFDSADFFNATIENTKLREVSFHGSILSRLDLIDIDIDTADCFLQTEKPNAVNEYRQKGYFKGVCLCMSRMLSRKLKKKYLFSELLGDGLSSKYLYNNLFYTCQRNNLMEEASDMLYYKRRAAMVCDNGPGKFQKFWEWLSFALTGFMQSIFRVMVIALTIIVTFAMYYENNSFYTLDKKCLDWFEALYFSAVTFMTLGYGDISPKLSSECKQLLNCSWKILIPSAEALMGAITIALIVVMLSRSKHA